MKPCTDCLASFDMKFFVIFVVFILEPLNQFNTIFQMDTTQIAILLPEISRLLREEDLEEATACDTHL